MSFRVPSLPHSQRLSVASSLLVRWFNSSLLSFPQLFCKVSASLQPSSLAHFQQFFEICQPKAAPSLLAHCSEMWNLPVFRQLDFTISCFKMTSISTSNSILEKVVWAYLPHPSTNNHTKKFLVFKPITSLNVHKSPPIDALEVLLAPTSPPDLSSCSLAMDAPQNSLHTGFLLSHFALLLPQANHFVQLTKPKCHSPTAFAGMTQLQRENRQSKDSGLLRAERRGR